MQVELNTDCYTASQALDRARELFTQYDEYTAIEISSLDGWWVVTAVN